MGLFGNPNKKIEKLIKQLEKKGYSREAYKTRKSCYNCRWFSPSGNCRYHNKKVIPAGLCQGYSAK